MDKRYAPKQLFLGLLFSNSHCGLIKNSSIQFVVAPRKNIQIIFSSSLVTLPPSRNEFRIARAKSRACIWPIMGHTGSITTDLSANHTTNLCLFFSKRSKLTSHRVDTCWSDDLEACVLKGLFINAESANSLERRGWIILFRWFWRIIEELKRRIVTEID